MDKSKRNNEEEIEDMWEKLKQIVLNNIVKKKVKKKKKIQGMVGYQLFQEEERGKENM